VETEGIVSSFMQEAVAVEGQTTYGTSGQRFEAARALQRDTDSSGRATSPPRYLIDTGKPNPDTGEIEEGEGEIVIRVSDLTREARVHVGSTPHKWLDARMAGIGWKRVRLEGYGLPGRAGRRGPHARCDVYRGSIPASEADDEDESVNT
jgi:hypothetical protein